MDQDRSSVKSNDSGGGFEFVQNSREDQPELKIANNGNLEELKQSLSEVLKEEKTMEEQGKRVSTDSLIFWARRTREHQSQADCNYYCSYLRRTHNLHCFFQYIFRFCLFVND
jgi:PBP1b-binding outer membrane lipoprotein LpoB